MADDINARLNAILSDPAALSQVMTLAKGLMGGQNSQAAGGFPGFQSQNPTPDFQTTPSAFSGGNTPGNQSGFPENSENPLPVSLPKPTNQPQMKLPKDDRCELLTALKPFLRESRSDKVDMMIRVLQISKLARRR